MAANSPWQERWGNLQEARDACLEVDLATQPPSEDAMPVQYLVDEHGNRTAALVPIDEWRELQLVNLEFADDVSEELHAEALQAAAELEADPSIAVPIENVAKGLGIDLKPSE